VTVTPGNTAPVSSETVPLMVAVVPWAKAGAERSPIIVMVITNFDIILTMVFIYLLKGFI
jgi:hypothetical protein